MNAIKPPASDVAFTPSVKAQQERHGSRAAYARMEQGRGWSTSVTAELAAFIARRDSLFLATASAARQPYVQHRGGPPGFVHVLDARTLAFADYRGNRQYLTAGNLAENPRAFLFLIDYEQRQRIKLWGTARIVADDAALLDRLMPAGYRAQPEHAIVFTLDAWDANCPQHIPRLLPAADAQAVIARLEARIAELEARLAQEN